MGILTPLFVKEKPRRRNAVTFAAKLLQLHQIEFKKHSNYQN